MRWFTWPRRDGFCRLAGRLGVATCPTAERHVNQPLPLAELRRAANATVRLMQTYSSSRPASSARFPRLRSAFDLLSFYAGLWRGPCLSNLFHVMENAGWSCRPVAAPATLVHTTLQHWKLCLRLRFRQHDK